MKTTLNSENFFSFVLHLHFETTFYVIRRYILYLLIYHSILRFWVYVGAVEVTLEISAGYHNVVVLYLKEIS